MIGKGARGNLSLLCDPECRVVVVAVVVFVAGNGDGDGVLSSRAFAGSKY